MNEQVQRGVRANRFLGRLSPRSLERLAPHLESVELSRRQRLFAPDDEVGAVYFVTRGLISTVKSMHDGRVVEVGVIGVEGVAPLGGLLGLKTALLELLVPAPGAALRLKPSTLREAAARDPALAELALGYVGASIGQIAQTAACNRLHGLTERCCRWLLRAHDSAGGDTFQLTHEFLALMLGVQRPGVSLAANALQREGLIRYRSGMITVLDRAALEASACECYGAMQAQFAALYQDR